MGHQERVAQSRLVPICCDAAKVRPIDLRRRWVAEGIGGLADATYESALIDVAEALVLVKGDYGGERLAAGETLDLLAAVSVHPLVTAEVGELGVRLQADLALERLDALVDVLMLLQAARRGEVLPALGTRVRSDRNELRAEEERRGPADGGGGEIGRDPFGLRTLTTLCVGRFLKPTHF